MPRHLLDTNMCITLMKNQPLSLGRKFAQCQVGDSVMSAITVAELDYGVAASADPERERGNLAALTEDIPVAPFDHAAGKAYGPIRSATREQKKDHVDLLIAAQAVALGLTLVTDNLKACARLTGLQTQNRLLEE